MSKPFKLIILSLIWVESPARFPKAQIAWSWISTIGESINAIIFGIPPLEEIDTELSVEPLAMFVIAHIASKTISGKGFSKRLMRLKINPASTTS